MSVPVGSNPPPDFINKLLSANFHDLVVLAGAWDRSKEEFDDELRVLCERLELRKQEYARECRELGGRSAKVEWILLRIWGVDDSHLEGQIPETRVEASPTTGGSRVTKCDDLAIEAEEREEMERAIVVIATTIRNSPLTNSQACDSASERERYTVLQLQCPRTDDHVTDWPKILEKAEVGLRCIPAPKLHQQGDGATIHQENDQRGSGEDSGRWDGDMAEHTMIGWTYNTSIASRLCRPAEVFRDFDVAQWMEAYDPEHCPCRSRRYVDMRNRASIDLLQCEGHTHVITPDSSITDNPLLQGIINSGLNHIPCMALDVNEAENEMGGFLDRLMAEVMELRELTTSTQSFLRRVILRKAKARMTKYKEQHRHVTAEPFEHPALKRELEFLTGRFLICPTDKAPNTPAFVCKNFIRKLAFQRLSEPEFASIAAPPASVIARIQGELSAMPALPMAPPTLPYLMTVFKAHKDAFRWITNTAGTVVSPAADLCACLLRFLLPLVQTFCQERSLETEERYGVKPNLWWSIASVGEFYANLPERIYFIFTSDITKCFETIPTDSSEDGLPAAVKFYVQSAMRVKRERSSSHIIRIRVGESGRFWPSWVDGDQMEGMGSMLFKEEDVCWLTKWCIANSVLRMGDYVWRQVKGIPMGLACSPIWYIDDLGAINNTIIGSFMRRKEDRVENDPCWIYPDEFIEIKENTEVVVDGCGRRANFLSVTITITSPETGAYVTSRHDKREGLGLAPCRFMKYKSNRSAKQALQIITAQVAQILLLCSEPSDAAMEINKVVTAMKDNGFARDACWGVVRRTLRQKNSTEHISLPTWQGFRAYGQRGAGRHGLGEPVLKPFLQDVTQFGPLSQTLAAMATSQPQLVPTIVAQIGIEPLVDWMGHFTRLGAYSFLSSSVSPVLRTWINSLSPEEKFRWKRRMEAWEFGSGLDYHS
ncbi:hypothetical protein CBR_g12620 [Chara braunii]|uniref:Uncharacterized protein n=1 Tax=Chara braunii TaxID=69332 RepID=A0A388KS55_CHABU|nr:hypothetical protein CBR_g12620 [Chara braunii]|eukprot:GBG72900.1 hypothetical protein CBR_g12620 [Chara braunii]